MRVTFVETTVFTRRIVRLGLEEPLRRLQAVLADRPDAGDLDPGTGGLRKIRMPEPGRGKGKRGGAQVHYLPLPDRQLVYMVFVYSKDETETLTAEQKRILSGIVRRIRQEHER